MRVIEGFGKRLRVVEQWMLIQRKRQDRGNLCLQLVQYFLESVRVDSELDLVETVLSVELHPEEIGANGAHCELYDIVS